MDIKELADILHSCGINAFSKPSSRAADDWNLYREKIADQLLHICDISIAKETEGGK